MCLLKVTRKHLRTARVSQLRDRHAEMIRDAGPRSGRHTDTVTDANLRPPKNLSEGTVRGVPPTASSLWIRYYISLYFLL